MSCELRAAQESSQKQDVTIQSLKELLKSRESEVKYYVIVDQWEAVHPNEVDKYSVFCRSHACQISKPYHGCPLSRYFGMILLLTPVEERYCNVCVVC